MFSENKAERVRRFHRFVSVADEDAPTKVYEGKKWPTVLGPEPRHMAVCFSRRLRGDISGHWELQAL